ncbi:MAG TPA: hypothetical protein VJC20_01915 [Candidatus Paceibacterota bacterium]
MKELTIGTIVVAFGSLVGMLWQQIPQYPILAFSPLLFVVLWASAAILVARPIVRYGISMISIVFLTLSLGQDIWTLAGGLIGMLGAFLAVRSIDRQYRAASAFSFRFVVGQGITTFLTALALLFSFSYYGAIAEKPVDTSRILPRDVFRIALRATEGIIQKQLPGFRSEATVDDTLALVIQQQLAQSAVGNQVSIPSLETIKKELPSQRKEIIANLNRDLGLSIDLDISGDEKVSSALYQLSASRVEPYLEPYSALIPSLMAIAFFFALKTVSMVYYYLTLLLLPAVFWFLHMSGLVEKQTVPAEKEIFKLA